jgi:hypothetical protein
MNQKWFGLVGTLLSVSCSLRLFNSLFGLPPHLVEYIHVKYLEDIPKSDLHFLWALHFLKQYSTVDTAAAFWHTSTKTYMKYVWEIIFLLESVLDEVGK